MRSLVQLALAAGVLALAAHPAAAQHRPELRPFSTLLIDAPLLYPEKVEATFVRIDTASIHVVSELSAGDTLVLPLQMVRRAYLRREAVDDPAARRRGTRRGALIGVAAGAVAAAVVLSIGEGELKPTWWRAAVGIPLGGGAVGALLGRQEAGDPGWTRIDLLRYRPVQFPLDVPNPPAADPPAGTDPFR